jgi:C1A family cysteine protease
MMNSKLTRVLTAAALIFVLTVGSSSILAQGIKSGPEAAGSFEPPGEYPLIDENSVEIDPVIKPTAYDLTPPEVKRSFPTTFDLRNVDGHNYVTPVKSQSGGTCWTHGTMASLESHMLMSGLPWLAYLPEQDYPCMDEYHLDWWNGFNQFHNADISPPTGEGLEVHNGGDYLVSAAYFARNDGAVDRYLTTGVLYQGSYTIAAVQHSPDYDYYFPREIEWLTAGTELENIDAIKDALQTHGVVATAICWSAGFYNAIRGTFYQPPSNTTLPNHSVAIVGWNDDLITQAPLPGAWLCKNSWGASWGQSGYFWVSYYDKVAGKHPEMGAVVFHDIEIADFRTVYSRDYHGWRDTRETCMRAINAFTCSDDRMISDASFISAVDNVTYTLEIFDDFDESGGPTNLLASAQGALSHLGLHTVTLDRYVKLRASDDFYVSLQVSDGGMAFDRTSLIPVLLGGVTSDALVRSQAAPGQSYYWENDVWYDLYDDDTTANFCIKALAGRHSPVGATDTIGVAPFSTTFSATWPDAEILGYQWSFDGGDGSSEPTPTRVFDEPGFHSVTLNLTTSEGTVEFIHKDVIAVHADTMTVTSGIVGESGMVKVDLLLHNYLPLETLVVPLTWDGPLQVSFDSISVAGLRLDGLGFAYSDAAEPGLPAVTLYWVGGNSDLLAPGEGALASVYFTVQAGTVGEFNPVRIQEHSSIPPQLFCAGLTDYLPALVDGRIVMAGCCNGRVGNVNGQGLFPDEITLGDIMMLVDVKYVSGNCSKILCLTEADVNQDGGADPNCDEHVTLGDIMALVDFLFITGPENGVLPDCL